MKRLLAPLLIGLALLYFVAAAVDVKIFSMEMFIRNLFHFLTGFVLLGIWIWHKRKLTFKAAVYSILAIVLAYDIVDYIRNATYLRIEMVLHDLFVLLWGGVTGYLYLRGLKRKRKPSPEIP
jgi:hypothetical protein